MASRRWSAALAVALVLGACGANAAVHTTPSVAPSASEAGVFPLTLTDDDGVSVTIDAPPQRIVTWAPSNTEMLFALGLGPRVVGVSGSFDNFPPQATSLPSVAGQGGVTPDPEKVVALNPDLVLNGFQGGDGWKRQLRKLGVPVFSIYASTLNDALHDIETVGAVTDRPDAAAELTAAMRGDIQRSLAPFAGRPRVSCFFEAYYPPLTTVGPHTFIYDVLEQAGCDPVSSTAGADYAEWSVEKLVQNGPAVYLAASESAASVAAVRGRPGFSGIAAVAGGKVFLIDSDLITRPGPRVVEALVEVAKDLHAA
jgi:iron complex transport system substrate-binding protein